MDEASLQSFYILDELKLSPFLFLIVCAAHGCMIYKILVTLSRMYFSLHENYLIYWIIYENFKDIIILLQAWEGRAYDYGMANLKGMGFPVDGLVFDPNLVKCLSVGMLKRLYNVQPVAVSVSLICYHF